MAEFTALTKRFQSVCRIDNNPFKTGLTVTVSLHDNTCIMQFASMHERMQVARQTAWGCERSVLRVIFSAGDFLHCKTVPRSRFLSRPGPLRRHDMYLDY